MASLAMPFLIINFGGEMLYILEQRLQAQNISSEKSRKVLQDVISTMFSTKFVEELFKPQDMYTALSVRQIFDRLAHSSIMRLNESSMDKLYDLMTMGFKYQLSMAIQPSELVQISLNHLDLIGVICKDSDSAPLIDHTRGLLLEKYSLLSPLTWFRIKQTLFNFVQDRRIKVSLFLQDNIQNSDGSINLTHCGFLPPNTCIPGRIRSISHGSVKFCENIVLPNSVGVLPNPERIPTLLGINLYSKVRPKTESTAPANISNPQSHAVKADNNAIIQKAAYEKVSKAAKVELALLSDLIKIPKPQSDNFTLQLFQDNSGNAFSSSDKEMKSDIIIIEAGDKLGRQEELNLRLKSMGFEDDHVKSASENDLLDLLDSTS